MDNHLTVSLEEITKENWEKVVFLSADGEEIPRICEEIVASNALSLVQTIFEPGWHTRAILLGREIIGFLMYGFFAEGENYEFSRIMLDKKYQGLGYGKRALKLGLAEMRREYGDKCREIYTSFGYDDERAKHLFEAEGFIFEEVDRWGQAIYVRKD